MISLRPYQVEAVAAVENEWASGVDKTLLVLPTGAGKTIVFSQIITNQVKAGKKCLILAHRGELLEQAQDKLYKSFGLKSAIEKAEESSLDSFFQVTVGSVQTLMRDKRLEQFSPDHFDIVIVDEAHHSISDSYQKVLNYFSTAKVLGVTATPDRGDMKNLGSFYESLAYEYSLVRAIKEGYLSPIKALSVPLEIDITGVKTTAGDYQLGAVGAAIEPYLEAVANEMTQYCADRKTVVFLPLVSTSQKFTEILNQKGFKAIEVNGNSEDRAEVLEDFDKGRYNVICNAMLLTEGWDSPAVDCVVVLRPTKVRSLYSQMVGRGTRLHPGKEHLLLLDFLYMTERNDLVRPASLIAKDEDVVGQAQKLIEDSAGEALDLEDLVSEAEQDVVEQREEALAKELDRMRKKKRRLVDPLQYELSIMDEDLVNYVPSFGWEIEAATDKQVKALERFGIFADKEMSRGKATALIDRLKKRSDLNMSTPKQIRLLEGRGFRHVGQWTKEDASKLIARISANGWRMPNGVVPSTYQPEGRS